MDGEERELYERERERCESFSYRVRKREVRTKRSEDLRGERIRISFN